MPPGTEPCFIERPQSGSGETCSTDVTNGALTAMGSVGWLKRSFLLRDGVAAISSIVPSILIDVLREVRSSYVPEKVFGSPNSNPQ